MNLYCMEEIPMSPDFLVNSKKFQSICANDVQDIPIAVMTQDSKKNMLPNDTTMAIEVKKSKERSTKKESSKKWEGKKKNKIPRLKTDISASFKATRRQLDALKDFFALKPYPSSDQKTIIAKSLGLSAAYVKGWFGRERRKYKDGKANYGSFDIEKELVEENTQSEIVFYGSEDMEDLPFDCCDFTGFECNIKELTDGSFHAPDRDLMLGAAVLDSNSEESDSVIAIGTLDVDTKALPKTVMKLKSKNSISFGSLGFGQHYKFKHKHKGEDKTNVVKLASECDPCCDDIVWDWFDDQLMAEGELKLVDSHAFKLDAFIAGDDIEFRTNLKQLEFIIEHF